MDDSDELLPLINEHRTRKKHIVPQIGGLGWLKKIYEEEIDSVKSDFANKNFVFFDGRS